MSIWEKILFKGQSDFNSDIRVTDFLGKRRLVVNGYTQSQLLLNQRVGWLHYWSSMVPEFIQLGADSRVLILGLGAGTIAKIISDKFGMVAIDGVEIDPTIVELGKKYFDMNESNLKVFLEDAKEFVKKTRFKYDLICLDVFNGGAVPKDLETQDFFRNVSDLLKNNGVLAINRIFHSKEEESQLIHKLKNVFKYVQINILKGNTIIFVSQESMIS